MSEKPRRSREPGFLGRGILSRQRNNGRDKRPWAGREYRRRLVLEQLEPRRLLASSLAVDLTGDLFKIDAASEEVMDITILRDGSDLVVVDHAAIDADGNRADAG